MTRTRPGTVRVWLTERTCPMTETDSPDSPPPIKEENAERRAEVEEAAVRRRLCYYEGRPEEIADRRRQLDEEWSLERALVASGSTVILGGLVAGMLKGSRLPILPLAAAGCLFQYALNGWTPPVPVAGATRLPDPAGDRPRAVRPQGAARGLRPADGGGHGPRGGRRPAAAPLKTPADIPFSRPVSHFPCPVRSICYLRRLRRRRGCLR